MADVVKAVEVIDPDGRIRIHPRHALDFDYRRLKWPPEAAAGARPPILVSGFFHLFYSDPESLREEAAEILRMRREKQPWRRPSAGCFFKNPPGERSAGELIALAGLKGKRIGDARVSEKHANFIVNTGRATASEILALAETVNETVWKAFGVTLEPEVEIIGT
jgi:UDP-N-acetylmuramate dehydrogenase